MLASLLVAAAIAVAYGALIAGHVTQLRRGDPPGTIPRPRLAVRLASRPGAPDRERAAVAGLLAGVVHRRRYHAEMAALAARDAVEHPLRVPGTHR